MNIQNQANATIEAAIKAHMYKIYGHVDPSPTSQGNVVSTKPLKTNLVETKVSGANRSTLNLGTMTGIIQLRNAMSEKLQHILHIHKSVQGTFTLKALYPMSLVSPSNTNRPNSVTTFVEVSLDPNDYERNILNENMTPTIAYGDGNFSAMALLNYEAPNSARVYSGAILQATLNSGYIPMNVTEWNKPIDENSTKAGVMFNRRVIAIWKQLSSIVNNEDIDDTAREEQLIKYWTAYNNLIQTSLNSQLIVQSSTLVAEPNSILPIGAAMLGVNSSNPLMDSSVVYGTKEAMRSLPPVISHFSGSGLMTDKTISEHGFHYGVFKRPDSNTKAGELEQLFADEDIARNIEICSRELLVADTKGQMIPVQIRAIDIRRGSGPMDINKRSRALAAVNPDTLLNIDSAQLRISVRQAECLAVVFELSNVSYRQATTSVNNVVTASAFDFVEDNIDIDALSDELQVLAMNPNSGKSDDLFDKDFDNQVNQAISDEFNTQPE